MAAQLNTNAATLSAINRARAAARSSIAEFISTNVRTLNVSLAQANAIDNNIQQLENISQWLAQQNSWWYWFQNNLLGEGGYESLDGVLIDSAKIQIDLIRQIGVKQGELAGIMQIANAQGGLNEAQQNRMGVLASQMIAHFESILQHFANFTYATTLPGERGTIQDADQQNIPINFPLSNVFDIADNFNTPFTAILQSCFTIQQVSQRVVDMLAVQSALNTNIDYAEIPTRIKIKYLNKAMTQATTVGAQISALEGLVSNSREHAREGGFLPADIYEADELLVLPRVKELLAQLRTSVPQGGGIFNANGVGSIGFHSATGGSLEQNNVALYLTRWCNSGRGAGKYALGWNREDGSKGRMILFQEKITAMIADIQSNDSLGYLEKARKFIKSTTLSFPNTMPRNKADFAVQEGEDFHPMAVDDDDQEMMQPYNPDEAYNAYIITWFKSIWRTRQNIYKNSVGGGGARIPGELLQYLGTLDAPTIAVLTADAGIQPPYTVPPATMEDALKSVFPWPDVANLGGLNFINNGNTWNNAQGGIKSIYKLQTDNTPIMVNDVQVGGKRRKKSRRKSRKRKQKGGKKRKAKRRKSRKKRGGAPTALTPEEKASNEDEGTPEIIPEGEGEKILKEIEEKKAKAETTPAAAATETTSTVTTPAAEIPVETTSTVTTPEVTTPAAEIPVETTPEVTTPEVTTPEVTTPEVTTPEVTTPEVTTPEVTTPEVTTPEVTTPEVTTPEVTTPEVTTPEVTTPEVTTSTAVAPVTSEIPLENGNPPAVDNKANDIARKKILQMSPEELQKHIRGIIAKAKKALEQTAPAGGYKKKKRRKKRKTKRKNKRKKNKSKKRKKRC